MYYDIPPEEPAVSGAPAEPIVVIDEEEAYRLVVTFRSQADAEAAVRAIGRTLRRRSGGIYHSALVTREPSGEGQVHVQHLYHNGLAGIARGGFDLLLETGRDGFLLAWSALALGADLLNEGWRVARSFAGGSLALLGSLWPRPRRRRLVAFRAGQAQQPATVQLAPGETAVVLVADRETADQLAAGLANEGGHIA